MERRIEELIYSIVFFLSFLVGMVYFSSALSFTSLLHSSVFLVMSLPWLFIWLLKSERSVYVVSLVVFLVITFASAFLTGYIGFSDSNYLVWLVVFVASGYSSYRIYNLAAFRRIRFRMFLPGMFALYFFMHGVGKIFRGIF